MLNTSVIEETNIITLDFDGSLDVEDQKRWRTVLNSVLDQHGTARVLAEIGEIEFGRIEPKAAWMELKSAGYFDKIDQLAVVSDASWITKISEWTSSLTSTTLRTFPSDQRDQAMAWLTDS